jgi:hypothetical protein
MAVSSVASKNPNIRTRDAAGTTLKPATVGEFLRSNSETKLKTVTLKAPMSSSGIAKQLHLSAKTATKVLDIARGYQNYGVDTKIHASVMLIPDSTGKQHQTVLVGGPTGEAGKSAWKPGQTYKGTILDAKNGQDVMHIRFQAKDARHFVYMSQA